LRIARRCRHPRPLRIEVTGLDLERDRDPRQVFGGSGRARFDRADQLLAHPGNAREMALREALGLARGDECLAVQHAAIYTTPVCRSIQQYGLVNSYDRYAPHEW